MSSSEDQVHFLLNKIKGDNNGIDGIQSIDFAELWSQDRKGEDYLVNHILPSGGREVAVFAPGGTGKTEFALAGMVFPLVTGRSVLGEPPKPPIDVSYFDREMTPDDIKDSLIDAGLSPNDDLSHLHYYQHQAFEPLDTATGGAQLLEVVKRDGSQLVVLDTLIRFLQGDENSSTTIKDFDRYTGSQLKKLGVGLIRLDHAGMDPTKGQRGTSAKNDDVDIVWELKRAGKGRVVLTCRKSRVSYIQLGSTLTLVRTEDPVGYSLPLIPYQSETAELAKILDDLKVSVDASSSVAMTALSKAGKGRRKALVLDALRFRRNQQSAGSQNPGTASKPTTGTDSGNRWEPETELDDTEPSGSSVMREPIVGTSGNRCRESMGTRVPLHSREPVSQTAYWDNSPPLSDEFIEAFDAIFEQEAS